MLPARTLTNAPSLVGLYTRPRRNSVPQTRQVVPRLDLAKNAHRTTTGRRQGFITVTLQSVRGRPISRRRRDSREFSSAPRVRIKKRTHTGHELAEAQGRSGNKYSERGGWRGPGRPYGNYREQMEEQRGEGAPKPGLLVSS